MDVRRALGSSRGVLLGRDRQDITGLVGIDGRISVARLVPGDPGDVGNWGDWVGAASLVVEAALVVLSLSMSLAHRQRSSAR